MVGNGEIILYEWDNWQLKIEVRLQNETVWLSIDQMAKLFWKSRSTINEHILNIYDEKELLESDTLRKIGNSDFPIYQAKTLSPVEVEYLNSIKDIEKQVKKNLG